MRKPKDILARDWQKIEQFAKERDATIIKTSRKGHLWPGIRKWWRDITLQMPDGHWYVMSAACKFEKR